MNTTNLYYTIQKSLLSIMPESDSDQFNEWTSWVRIK